MREKNPELSGEKKKFAMKPPEVRSLSFFQFSVLLNVKRVQVARAGSKKTAFSNFAEICRLMKRQDKHVLQFLLAELGRCSCFLRASKDFLEIRPSGDYFY